MPDVATGHDLAGLDTVILAGGMGSRLEHVLHGTPKLLAPIGGRPYLDYLFAWLGQFGLRRIIFSLGHLGDKVVQYLESKPFPGFEIAPRIEPEPMGTAGALRFVREEIHTDPALVMNGDSFVDADLGAFLTCHRRGGATASILCTEFDGAERYGQVEVDGDGRIARFIEKGDAPAGRSRISAGVYLLGAELLDQIAAGDQVSLERDVFAQLPPRSLTSMTGSFRFIDIGTPESMRAAQSVLPAAFPGLDPQDRR